MKRKELIERMNGALPRYSRSDDAKDDVVLKTEEVLAAIEYLKGERDD